MFIHLVGLNFFTIILQLRIVIIFIAIREGSIFLKEEYCNILNITPNDCIRDINANLNYLLKIIAKIKNDYNR